MAETLVVKFTPNEGDYVRGNRALMWRRPRMWLSVAPMIAVELFLLWMVVSSDWSNPALAWLMLLPLPVVFAALFWWMPYQAARRAKSNERLLAEMLWELREDQVVLKNRFTESKLDWGSFRSLTEDRDYFFLRHSTVNQLYNFIPKRAFASPQEEAAFRDLVTRHIGGA